MSYVVLARKWRPMGFDDLVGQEHVSRTLGNAIASGRVAHAFLFTGVRGVGKTTAARILAKALNCTGTADDPHTGPTASPCLQCSACREIALGTDVDVREIDGASYNGVDEVRKLQDSLPYRPARDRFKIFIVDEVHMLSQSAWNAFLKTLEEPPPHIKFIFATTEVHKVPITILSRVQRFDFKLIPTQLIANRLRHVLSVEKVESDDGALQIIAREAAGSMRDAMSLLDQVIAWNDQKLDADSVARVLGVASRQVLHDIARALVDGDAARCLDVVKGLANQGYDIATVARDLLALLRDLVVAKVCKEPADLLDLADLERRDVVDLATRATVDDLVRLHQGFSTGFDDVVRSGQPRAGLEMLLVRLARRPPLIPIDDLIARLATLEKKLGAPPRRGPSDAGDPRGPSRPLPSAPPQRRDAAPEAPSSAPRVTAEPAAEHVAPPRVAPAAEHVAPPRVAPAAEHVAPRPTPAPVSSPVTSPPRTNGVAVARAASNGAAATGSSGSPGAGSNGAPAGVAAWRSIIEGVRAERPELAACLHHATLVEASAERISLGFEPGSVFERAAQSDGAVALLRKIARGVFGAEPNVVLGAVPSTGGAGTVAALEDQERKERVRLARARAKDHPRIAEAAEILGARLKDIQIPDE
ncbi:MAG TPA: DNA polymerase III subunit gamma/tau [Polyangiaceae bacterium]|nr:DNA polymerase III subunit gamma/tau [Polyangiaceae bacterium]